ncbi:nuclear transport factor 2 family protein [Agromyces larvae]|uniref:Nuclear transport factor 2 family protein n=1 Tax=Agromyces larvae TaxID=2929802 RepID=A0ABY4C1G8_9MICO|nr:nuclear transport factor 2 family protein [Agromyces larvae]UOE45277.1 nuclear transport factor 2 family protein [Agromyces larvae]
MYGRELVDALVATINAGNVPGMDELFHEDAVMEWPQSGERIVGGDNRRAVYTRFPQLPHIEVRSITGEGDHWVMQGSLDYGDGVPVLGVFVFEVRDGRIAKETAYWPGPFEAPEWRAPWVERMT